MAVASEVSADQWVTQVVAADEAEVIPALEAAFPGLEHADPEWVAGMSAVGALRTIGACEAAIARIQAVRLRALARLARVRGDPRTAVAELALATSSTEARSRQQLDLAETMSTRLPDTLAAMDRGVVDEYKASKVADATAMLDDEQARRADEIAAPRLAGKNPAGVRQAAARVAARVDPDGVDRRARARRHYRRVQLTHQTDGMATLTADLPAETASAIHTRLDRMARARRGPDEPRNLDQLRADSLADLCLGRDTVGPGEPGVAGVERGRGQARAEIFVHVSLGTLVGAEGTPAELTGHGPIPAALARAIAHEPGSTWRRILTDPTNGQIVDVGRTRYRPPVALDDLVRIRDRTCRHPGCYRPSHHGDLDHHIPWAGEGGSTSAANLVGLCRKHHRLKDEVGWKHHMDQHGTLTVTTPTGRGYTSNADPPPF